MPEGPSRDAGMEAGDVILTFEGVKVDDVRELVRLVGNANVGSTVEVVVLREGKEVALAVTLGRREVAQGAVPASQPAPEADDEPMEKEILGLTVTPLTDEMRGELGVADDQDGLVVSGVDETSKAYEKGLRAGDVLTEASHQKLRTIADFETRIEEVREAGRKSVLLLVRRGGEPRFVALSIE